jgi:hypothetical protein
MPLPRGPSGPRPVHYYPWPTGLTHPNPAGERSDNRKRLGGHLYAALLPEDREDLDVPHLLAPRRLPPLEEACVSAGGENRTKTTRPRISGSTRTTSDDWSQP